jgi:uncharacterized protein YdaU (DUF1376 family)
MRPPQQCGFNRAQQLGLFALNYYQFHIGDYARDTAHLSMVEEGAYRRLLDIYYVSDGNLVNDLPKICRLARARSQKEMDVIQEVLHEFFYLEADNWKHRRCDAEIMRAQSKSLKASESAARRWHQRGKATDMPKDSDGNANAMRTHIERNANGMLPISNNQEPKGSARKRATKTPLPPDFVISDRVRSWASAQGYPDLDRHLDAFKRKCAIHDYRYVDWDLAFMEAVRGDWAKLRVNGAHRRDIIV